jgi:hypothetical protein
LEDAVDASPHARAAHQQAAPAPIPAAACYAQVVYCEDVTVGGVLVGGRPLALGARAGRTGLSELPPLGRSIVQPLAERADWSAWGRRVEIDLPALRAYARAVHAATDGYVATMPDHLLAPARRALPGCLLNALLLTLAMRRGEIAALAATTH